MGDPNSGKDSENHTWTRATHSYLGELCNGTSNSKAKNHYRREHLIEMLDDCWMTYIPKNLVCKNQLASRISSYYRDRTIVKIPPGTYRKEVDDRLNNEGRRKAYQV